MPMSYLTPGVYVEEVSGGPRPIEAVGTSTAGFVGVAPRVDAHLNEAYPVNNWSEFLREFSLENAPGTALAQAVFGFFQNGGSRCYIVNIGTDPSISGGGTSRRGLQLLEEVDEVAIVAAPGYTDAFCVRRAAVALREAQGSRGHSGRAALDQEPRPADKSRDDGGAGEAGQERQGRCGRRPAQQTAAPGRAVRMPALARSIFPGSPHAMRRAVMSSRSRRRATSPGSTREATPPAACTRRRPTKSSAVRSA